MADGTGRRNCDSFQRKWYPGRGTSHPCQFPAAWPVCVYGLTGRPNCVTESRFPMRGAGLRLNNDVRRLWRCAVCGAERRAGAFVTSVRCECSGNPSMKLVETQRLERPLKEATSPYLEFVFEPGELNPPRPPVEDLPPEGDMIDAAVDESGAAAPPSDEGSESRSRQSRGDSRPQRRPDRRDSNRPANGPRPGPGGPKANDAGPIPPKGPRPERPPLSSGTDRADAGQSDTPAQSRPPRRDRSPKDPNRTPPAAPASDGFGEGIPEPPA
jgi:hypothetical protein